MPVYDFICEVCSEEKEVIAQMGETPPACCGVVMTRLFSSSIAVRDSHSLTGKRHERWIDRMNDIHKRQADKGERLRFVHPSEIL